MRLLADRDPFGPLQQPLDGDPGFGPGQGRAGAGVRPAAEGDVLAGVGPARVERVRIGEPARVVLEDLRARLRATRWPDAPQDAGWSLGTDLAYLRELVAYARVAGVYGP